MICLALLFTANKPCLFGALPCLSGFSSSPSGSYNLFAIFFSAEQQRWFKNRQCGQLFSQMSTDAALLSCGSFMKNFVDLNQNYCDTFVRKDRNPPNAIQPDFFGEIMG